MVTLAYKSHYNLSTVTQGRAAHGQPCQEGKQNSCVAQRIWLVLAKLPKKGRSSDLQGLNNVFHVSVQRLTQRNKRELPI